VADDIPDLDETCLVLLQAGHVCTGAFDDFASIMAKAEGSGAWVHVDGAFGLWAAASPALRHLTDGMEAAQSWSTDAHKTLNAPYDCGIVFCRQPDALLRAMHAAASYLTVSEARDGMALSPDMSRRARAVELWAMLKYLGSEGVADLVEGLHANAKLAADYLAGAGFEILNEVVFNQVLFRADRSENTQRILSGVQAGGHFWMGGATWQGAPAIRLSVCSWMTTEAHIRDCSAELAAALHG
jgi:glutamate/tyrosine decarboxylase-like PLP-dependent enzyme